MTLDNTTLSVAFAATLNNALDFQQATAPISYAASLGFSTGVGAGQADRIFADQRTIAASSNDDLDLAGVLVDALGAVVTMARVKGIIVKAAAANTNNVVIGNAASNQFVGWFGAATHTLSVRPGGLLALFAPDTVGYLVTAATADILRFANSGAGTGVTYDVIILGASA